METKQLRRLYETLCIQMFIDGEIIHECNYTEEEIFPTTPEKGIVDFSKEHRRKLPLWFDKTGKPKRVLFMYEDYSERVELVYGEIITKMKKDFLLWKLIQ